MLVAEVEEGEEEDRHQEGWEVESGVSRVKERQPCGWRGDECEVRKDLEPM